MKPAAEVKLANLISRIIRWALGITFLWMAYTFEDARILYFFGTVLIVTGFLKPKRCTDNSCEI